MSRARDNASLGILGGSIEGTEVAFLENATAAQELSGTYSTERLYFNDSYQLTGDVTVTGHLALGSIADEDVVITQDSTERTITGSGTLEAGNVLQDTYGTDLTGMTGELGSVVTGSPALNLTNATGDLSNAIPYNSGSGSGSQNIGGLRFQWGTGTLPSSGSDVGSSLYGVANRHYWVQRVNYSGFSEAPHLAHAMQGNGYHETKIANYEFQHGHSSGDYFNFIVTSSRTAGWVNTTYKWMLIGKAS